jgi:tRNA-specific 2-thiouridylase
VKVLAALSGGVDSAVAAARLVDQGHQVVGVHLALSQVPSAGGASGGRSRGCCSASDARDARRVADRLGIPFYVWDVSQEFQRDVVADFVAEYASGRTPNPCVRCNEKIKFAAVLDRAHGLGFDAVATGHYARIVDGADGPVLARAADRDKDQSYVLGVLTSQQLNASLFPLGASTKPEVRAEAADRGLLVADKPDSTDLCFVADGDTAGYLARRLGEQPGPIVDEDGSVVGAHTGSYGFTIGQRRGLNLAVPAADGRPRYVLAIEPTSRTVTVGPATSLEVTGMRGAPAAWAGTPRTQPFRATAQYRAHGVAVDVWVEPGNDVLHMTFCTPQRGVAPGQTAVLYAGDEVLASATIEQTVTAPRTVAMA